MIITSRLGLKPTCNCSPKEGFSKAKARESEMRLGDSTKIRMIPRSPKAMPTICRLLKRRA